MVELVSISEAARRLGHDFRTVRKVVAFAEPKVVTRTGKLYNLDEIRHLINRSDRAQKMMALRKI
jgi:hypothetical protein